MRLLRSKTSCRGLILSSLLLPVAALSALKWWPRDELHRVVPRSKLRRAVETSFDAWIEPQVKRVAVSDPTAAKIVKAARAQEGDDYDASYLKLSYPGGDVPKGRGACTDVVVRALRGAGFDLQHLVHEDMRRDFGRYPDPWKLRRTDKNIDHRRVPNLSTYFEKYGQVLPLQTSGKALKTWLPGDIVTWKLAGNKDHIGVVSDGIGTSGKPMVVHNAFQCIEQDYLDAWPIVGHFRFPKRALESLNHGASS
ncbi:MAG TPA: DUF1287 domain-containing protein [Abditibacterium sp.]|jgi:hypothetical protein